MTYIEIKEYNTVINAYMETKKSNYYKSWDNIHCVISKIYYDEWQKGKVSSEVLLLPLYSPFDNVFKKVYEHIKQKQSLD